MELSSYTMQVLKNFATINSNIVIHPGSSIKTMSEARNILSATTVPEKFTQTIGIYDLPEFLSVLGLVDVPNIVFDDKYATVSDSTGRVKIKYFFSDPSNLTSPEKTVVMPATNVSFTLDQSTLNNVKRAASALGHTGLCVRGNDNSITLTVVDVDNQTSNAYSIEVAGTTNLEEFNFIINIGNLKLLAGDYQVDISNRLISQFTHKDHDMKYWIALEKASTFK